MSKKRIICLLVVMILCVSCIGGCSCSKEGSDSKSDSNSTNSTSSNNTNNYTLSEYLKDKDMVILYKADRMTKDQKPKDVYIFKGDQVYLGECDKTFGELSKMSDKEIAQYVESYTTKISAEWPKCEVVDLDDENDKHGTPDKCNPSTLWPGMIQPYASWNKYKIVAKTDGSGNNFEEEEIVVQRATYYVSYMQLEKERRLDEIDTAQPELHQGTKTVCEFKNIKNGLSKALFYYASAGDGDVYESHYLRYKDASNSKSGDTYYVRDDMDVIINADETSSKNILVDVNSKDITW